MKSTEKKEAEIKAYNLRQLACLYGVCRKTMNKWLRPFKSEIGEKQSFLFTKKQIEVIFQKLGHPDG